MTSLNVDIRGVRETVRALNKIEPGLRKTFTQEAQSIAAPAIELTQKNYAEMYLSGMKRNWVNNNRRLFPYDVRAARRNVKLKVDADRRALAVIRIEQRDPGTAVFETAGRRTINPLGLALGNIRPATTRVLGPSVYSRRSQIIGRMSDLVRSYSDRVERELR